MGRNHPTKTKKKTHFNPITASESNNEAPLRSEPTIIQKMLHPALEGVAEAINNSTGTRNASTWVRNSIVRPPLFKRRFASHPFSMSMLGEKPPPGYQWQRLRNEAGIVKEPGPYPSHLRGPLARFITQKARRKQGLVSRILGRSATYEPEPLAQIVKTHRLVHNNGSGSSGGCTRRKRRHAK
jgi:hypothetical protein